MIMNTKIQEMLDAAAAKAASNAEGAAGEAITDAKEDTSGIPIPGVEPEVLVVPVPTESESEARGEEAEPEASTSVVASLNTAMEKLDKIPEDATMYQHYKCSRSSMKMVTDKGKVIEFVKFQHITADLEVIAYLDREIAAGLNVVTKGKLMSREESDPMTILRKQAVKDYLQEQKELAIQLAETQAAGPTTGILSTSQVIAASDSTSSVGEK